MINYNIDSPKCLAGLRGKVLALYFLLWSNFPLSCFLFFFQILPSFLGSLSPSLHFPFPPSTEVECHHMTHSDVTLDMFFIKALMLHVSRCTALGALQSFQDEIWWFLFLSFIRNSMNLAVSQCGALRETTFHDKSTYLVACALCLGTVVGGLARLLGKNPQALFVPLIKR